jgi:hypothetical protein
VKLHVKIFDFFLKSSIWVAFAVCALTEITCMNFELKTDRPLLGFVFFATIFGYNFIKYFEKEHLSVQHSKILKLSFRKAVLKFKHLHTKEKVTFLMSAFCAIFCAILLFKLTTETKLLLCVPALLSFFYAVSFKEKTLRSTSGLKIYVVGIVWAIVTVILPISEASINMNYDIWITFTQRVVFVIVLILPFEIRDLKVDKDSLGTLPQKIGVGKTKVVGVLLLLVFLFLEFFKNDVLGINQIIIPLVFVVTLFFLVSSSVKQSKYYASFFVEGIPLLWLLLLLVQ